MTGKERMEVIDETTDMVSSLSVIAQHLSEIGEGLFATCGIVSGDLEVRVTPADLIAALTTLRDDRQAAFTQLIDLTAVDYPERQERFDVVYLLLSMTNNMRLRLVVSVGEGQTVPSVTGTFMSAN
ncbi:MAG: NADH-quinone oxidoreductase subunit C, partial [Candidatus Puniceispirillum sp.]